MILGVLLALLLVTDSVRRSPVSPEQAMPEEQAEQEPAQRKSAPDVFTPLQVPIPGTASVPKSKPPPARPYPYLPAPDKPTLFDRATSLVDTNKLKLYEGSYTLDQLGTGNGSGGVAVNLRSSWLIGNTNMPQAGLRVRLNPLTQQYEVVGGEVYLPGRGIGLSSEFDEGTGETRTFLNLQKEF
ncbi:MAG: hypothetical protein KJN98_03315 [Pontiella sp.]|nr:hypothetical protein [Pontiella sp.]